MGNEDKLGNHTSMPQQKQWVFRFAKPKKKVSSISNNENNSNGNDNSNKPKRRIFRFSLPGTPSSLGVPPNLEAVVPQQGQQQQSGARGGAALSGTGGISNDKNRQKPMRRSFPLMNANNNNYSGVRDSNERKSINPEPSQPSDSKTSGDYEIETSGSFYNFNCDLARCDLCHKSYLAISFCPCTDPKIVPLDDIPPGLPATDVRTDPTYSSIWRRGAKYGRASNWPPALLLSLGLAYDNFQKKNR